MQEQVVGDRGARPHRSRAALSGHVLFRLLASAAARVTPHLDLRDGATGVTDVLRELANAIAQNAGPRALGCGQSDRVSEPFGRLGLCDLSCFDVHARSRSGERARELRSRRAELCERLGGRNAGCRFFERFVSCTCRECGEREQGSTASRHDA